MSESEQTEFGELVLSRTETWISLFLRPPTKLPISVCSVDMMPKGFVCDFDAWWLARLNVLPAARRGQGVGSFLLRRVLHEVSMGWPNCVVVAPGGYGSDPERLDKFYRKNGFVDVPLSHGQLVWRQNCLKKRVSARAVKNPL